MTTFDLRAGHLGDVLMAMPAMRAEDTVLVSEGRYAVPQLDTVDWQVGATVRGVGEVVPDNLPGQHRTSWWLNRLDREPVQHQLARNRARSGIVLAPAVAAGCKRWGRWAELHAELILRRQKCLAVGGYETRTSWMTVLSGAHTVVCPDTGTAHMADALGVPRVIALHGSREGFRAYAPFWSRGKHCVVRDSMSDISVGDVLEAIDG